MQEVILVANMSSVAAYRDTKSRGARAGASIGRTREMWKTRDGYVTFGLRGGPARVPTLRAITQLLVDNGIHAPAWAERDWAKFNPNETSDAELRALEGPLAELFARYAMAEIFEIACAKNLMIAPANTAREIYASSQLAAREMFAPLDGLAGFPTRFAAVTSGDGEAAPIAARSGAPELDATVPVSWSPRPAAAATGRGAAWAGLKLVEFGSGAAGPIATRYFADHGATVVKIESRSRPDFLRIYALGPGNPHRLEGPPLFNALNTGQRSITLDLKDAKGIEIAKRLMFWADAVLENFAPKAMRGFGLDYQTLSAEKPDLVMVSSCMNRQTGPHRDYYGIRAQGSALSCFNHLTGWPDCEPMGPFGTITDSLSPRFAATGLAAGMLYRRRTGRGLHIDVSQVENALYTISPYLLDYAVNGHGTARNGNRSPDASPHGAFPCRAEGEVGDRWIAIAVWSDDEWAVLAGLLGLEDPSLATSAARLAREDEVERAVAAGTPDRTH